MQRKTWFISDLHFGHKNIMKYSPDTRGHFKDLKDMNDSLVEGINEKVRKKDILWILGDVAFGVDNLKYIRFIECDTINLILGNHDTYNIMDYIAVGFNKIQGMVQYKEFVLSHMPVHPQQLDNRYSYNIHGHLHTGSIQDYRYFNANIDVMGLSPIWLEDIRSEFKYREKMGNSNYVVSLPGSMGQHPVS